ncbi:MAG: hypothetical protein OXC19_25970 [Bryobacterales bacterium]|nr:hypothetical protein [Bryobacterales bacterium]
MTIRTPAADLTVPQGRPAFMQARFPGATSPNGPIAQAKAIFGGVAPAPPAVRFRDPSRPAWIANRLMEKALMRSQLLRLVLNSCCAAPRPTVRRGIFPARAHD